MRKEVRTTMRRKFRRLINFAIDCGSSDCGHGDYIPRALDRACDFEFWLERMVDEEIEFAVMDRRQRKPTPPDLPAEKAPAMTDSSKLPGGQEG